MQTLRRSALLLPVLAAAVAVAGCGSGEPPAAARLPSQVAEALAARSDAVAQRLEQGDACGARAEAEALQFDTIAAVNAGRVPARYQEELGSSAATLVASIECVPAPDEDEDGDGDGDKQKNKEKDDNEEERDEEDD